MSVTASVVIPTLARPGFLRTCLQHLSHQSVLPLETVVVDASPDDRSYQLVRDEFPAVRYLRNPFGAGHTATSRSLGVRATRGDIVVFLDDDAYADEDCIGHLLEPYEDGTVGGVGGRVRNGIPGEEHVGLSDIGQLRPDGTLTGNFAANLGRVVSVDHLLGACMSYRRAALEAIGGIHDGYPGTCLREETDIALRVGRAGFRLLYQPAAFVDHVAAPYPRGQRFDVRYDYFATRNHMVLLIRTMGVDSAYPRRYAGVTTREGARELQRAARAIADGQSPPGKRVRAAAGGVARAGARGLGLSLGLVAGIHHQRQDLRQGAHSRHASNGTVSK